ncbi:hypothetical protein [Pseudomonas sp. NPDC089401]|uniref:hypothetical protein n=1 Tax=Pseudomonas sp. NPDC089401 TaxID=3364462 RepID=UPI0038271D3B
MYDFTVTWQSREQVPKIPPGLLFAGLPQGAGQETKTPVIVWGERRAYVFDDQVDRQRAWLVVFGDGEHVSGGSSLSGFRGISDIRIFSSVSLELTDAAGLTIEIQFALLEYLSGSQLPGHGFEGLPLGIPFYLSNGKRMLVADGNGVHMAVDPDAGDGRWLFERGGLVHSSTRQVLGLGARVLPASAQVPRWHLSSQGVLSYGEGAHVLVVDPDGGQVGLRDAADASSADAPWSINWIPHVSRSKAEGLLVRKLDICLEVAKGQWPEVAGKVHFSINGSKARQLLTRQIRSGASLRVTVGLANMFSGHSIFTDDLHSIELFYLREKDEGPAWRFCSLRLEVNDAMSNGVLEVASPWLLPGKLQCWSGKVNWLNWRHKQGDSPLDHAGYALAEHCKALPASWLSWRSAAPETLDGACQLIGASQGRILAYDLVHETPVHLPANTGNDVYTWAYSPHGSFIVKHWGEAVPRDPFFKHCRLAAGGSVVCAGEMRIRRVASDLVVQDVLCMTNVDDARGYRPDRGACLVHVLERLGQLGFEGTRAHVYSRDPVSEIPAMQ